MRCKVKYANYSFIILFVSAKKRMFGVDSGDESNDGSENEEDEDEDDYEPSILIY